MREVAVVQHILGLVAGNSGEFPVLSQRLQPVLLPDFIHQADNLVLIAGDRGIQLGNAQDLSWINQVRVADLGVSLDDFAGTHLIVRGDLPHGIAFDNGVGETGGIGGRSQHGTGQSSGDEKRLEFFHRNLLDQWSGRNG